MLASTEAKESAVDALGLEHRVYIPQGLSEEELARKPIVLLVHGRAGNNQVMWVFSKALAKIKPIVVSPQGIIEDVLGGYSWWEVSKDKAVIVPPQTATTLEQLVPPLAALEHFVARVPKLYGGNPEKLYAVGFSQGGAILGALALKNPELFRGVGLLSSFIPQVMFDSYKPAGLPPFYIFHGTADEIVELGRGERTRDLLLTLGASVTWASDDVGHKVSSSGIRQLEDWFDDILK